MEPIEGAAASRSQNLEGVVTLGEWMVTLLVAAIPIVNIVMLFVWAFGANTKQSKANWAKASLIWILIAIVFSILISVMILGGLATLFSILSSD